METPPAPAPPQGKFPKVIVVLLIILAACAILAVCGIAILALLGPAVGNVFSNIVTDLPTLAP